MLRLALVAGLMSSAYGFATQGDMCMVYSWYDSNDSVATGANECAQESVGTTGGPVNTAVTNMSGARPIILGNCYELNASAYTLPVNSMFGIASAKAEAFVHASALGVEFNNNAGDVEMTPYTAAYASATLADPTGGCGNTAGTAQSHGGAATGTGWACADAGTTGTSSLGMGIALAANSYSACETAVNYVTVKTTASGLGGTLPSGSWTYATTAAQNIDHWPVAPNEFFAVPLAATDLGMTASYCFPSAFTYAGGAVPAGSWQMVCDLETGNIERTDDISGIACSWSSAVTEIFKRGSSNTTTLGKSGILANVQMSAVAATPYSTAMGFNIVNSSAEWDAVCSIPAHTATAKYFNGYLVAGTCATHTDALGTTDLAAANTATRSIIMGVCYTLNGSNQMPGWGLPFAAGAASTIPVASKKSVKFVETGAEIEMWHYTESDCSGTAAKTTSDDPADAWCQNSSKISHGGVGTAGNAATQLQTATNYITVRKHTDDTGANASDTLGMPGACLGIANVTTSSHLDHFVVHTNSDGGAGDSPATGCHQVVASSTNAAADGNAYAWWCDTTDYSINYGEFDDNKCAVMTAGTQLKFSKLAYDTCTEADSTDSTTTCTYPQTSSTETPSAFVYGTVTALVNGAAADFGGKCLVKAVDVSWEIITDDTTWDAICSAPASSSSEDDSDSAAGKVAATVAAGAAAAAALLI